MQLPPACYIVYSLRVQQPLVAVSVSKSFSGGLCIDGSLPMALRL
jgi:hypothetical protein